jgi:hypothetical protein
MRPTQRPTHLHLEGPVLIRGHGRQAGGHDRGGAMNEVELRPRRGAPPPGGRDRLERCDSLGRKDRSIRTPRSSTGPPAPPTPTMAASIASRCHSRSRSTFSEVGHRAPHVLVGPTERVQDLRGQHPSVGIVTSRGDDPSRGHRRASRSCLRHLLVVVLRPPRSVPHQGR